HRHTFGRGPRLVRATQHSRGGRDAEKRVLWDTLRQVCASRKAHTVILKGAAGLGKDRLAEWLCRQAHECGLALRARALHDREQGRHTGLRGLVAEQLQVEGLSRNQALTRVKLLMRRRGVQEAYWWLSLAAIACPEPAPQRSEGSGGFRFRDDQERHQAVGFLLREMCRERPVIVWLDDVQWGADALRFVRFMLQAQESEPCPLMFVLTVRDDDVPLSPTTRALLDTITSEPSTQTLLLAPLECAAQRQLIDALLELDGALAQKAVERTEGNPLFAVQMLDDWVQRDLLEPSPHGFSLRPGADLNLPDNMDALWERRLERTLGDTPLAAWIAMELAATLGPVVNGEEWRELYHLRTITIPEDLIDHLVKARLARRTETGWAFVHGLLQTRLLARADEAGRLAQHHRLCGAMLQAQFRETGRQGLQERIGAHLEHAGDDREAAIMLLRAAEERVYSGDFAHAEGLWHRWHTCAQRLGDTTPEQWARAGMVLARIQRRNGAYAEAAQTLERYPPPGERSLLMAEYLTEQARITSVLAMVQEQPELFQQTQTLHAQAESLYTYAASIHGRAEVALSRAFTAAMQRHHSEANTHFTTAIKLFEQIGDHLQYAVALVGLAEGELYLGQTADVRHKGERALAIFEAAGARHHICHALYGLAELDRSEGRMSSAETRYRRVLRLMEGMGSYNVQLARHALAQTLIERSAWSESAQLLDTILNTAAENAPTRFLQHIRCDALMTAAALARWERFDVLWTQLAALEEPRDIARIERAGRLALSQQEHTRGLLALEQARDAFEAQALSAKAQTIDLLIKAHGSTKQG
ncbi:MAG: AAA family ATPase, partial [Myxococcota bacterium]